jgi:hypothetical protein
VPSIVYAIPQLLFRLFRVLASTLEEAANQPFDAVYSEPSVEPKGDGVEGRISFKLRQG